MDLNIKKATPFLLPFLLMAPFHSFAKEKVVPEPSRISKHKDNFFMPYYKEGTVNQARFLPLNPNGKELSDTLIQFQFSFKYRLFSRSNDDGLYLAYTQKSNWQAYEDSAYFRDNDFNPEVFYKFTMGTVAFSLGFEHQSNGAGGKNEVSWDRGYIDMKYSGEYGYVRLKPWMRIKDKFDYNPNIETYLSDGELEIGVYLSKNKENELKVLMRNITDSEYYFYSASWSFPIISGLKGYLKYEDGYGLSISNYNYKTDAYGAGFSLSF